MLVALGFLGFFFALDLGITEPTSLGLISLAKSYSTAANDALRASYLAAANWGLATLPLATFFSWVGPSIGFVIASTVMLKSAYGRNTAILGIVTNGLGILCGFYYLFPIPILLIMQTPVLLLYGVLVDRFGETALSAWWVIANHRQVRSDGCGFLTHWRAGHARSSCFRLGWVQPGTRCPWLPYLSQSWIRLTRIRNHF